jgi:F-type H+-transporting ATPase subunit beta
MKFIDTEHPLQVPVGSRLLGRMFNVFGEPIDGGDILSAEKSIPIYQKSLSLAERITTADIYETGIKVIDV